MEEKGAGGVGTLYSNKAVVNFRAWTPQHCMIFHSEMKENLLCELRKNVPIAKQFIRMIFIDGVANDAEVE
jgi:hypothetical protein